MGVGERRRLRIALWGGACLFAAVGPGVSAAQSAEGQEGVGEAPAGAEASDIIVTARRRSESLAQVPAVVAAFSGDQLARQNITQQTDLQASVPGLLVRQTQSSNNLNYVIRGQSVDAFSGSATAIVPYINEVQFAPGGLSSFFDLESLQVLKGPQGTLFGRNATGGAVLLTTARPTDTLAARFQAGVGNYGFVNVQGMVNVPIIDDRLIVRLAADATYRDGYVRNLFNGQRTGKVSREVGRISLTARPVDGLENTTVFQHERSGGNNTSSVAYSYYKCGRLDPAGVPLTCSADSLYGPQLDANIGFPGAWNLYLAAHPGANPGGIAAALAEQKRLGFQRVYESNRTAHRGRNWFVSNTTTFDIAQDTRIKNIFGASYSHNSDLAGQIGLPYLILSTYNALMGPPALGTNSNDEAVRTVSNELQVEGKLFDGSLDYVIGGYYARTRNRIFYPATYTELTPVFPIIPDVFTSISHFKQSDEQKAVYAHGTLDLSRVGLEGVTASAGIRYTWERIVSTQLAGSRFAGGTPLRVAFDKPSWNLGIDWKVTPSFMVYAQTRGSWRTGGINGVARPLLELPALGGSLYLPETTHDVELGAKFNGDVAGRQAHLYLAGYRQIVKNIQRAQLINVPVAGGVTQPLNLTINVPSARIQGFEVESGIKIADWLEIGAVGAFTDAQYRNNRFQAFGQTFLYGPYGDAPRWSGTLHAQVTLPIGESQGSLGLRGEIYGQTGFYISNTGATRTPDTRVPGYSLVNLRAEWSDVLGRDGVSISAFARNLFNKGYYTGGFALGNLLGVNSANVGEPRMWGAQVKIDF